MNQNELAHFGILGMKWGIRRYQNKDGSFTKKGIANYQKVMNIGANKAKDRSILLEERIIPSGTRMYRTTGLKKDPNNDKSTYVSYLDVDRNHYKAGWIREIAGTDSAYEHQYQLSKDLKIPSRDLVQKTIKDVVLANEKYINQSVKAFVEMKYPKGSLDRLELEEYGEGVKNFTKNFIDDYGKMPLREVSYTVCQSLGLAPNVKKAIIKNLSDKGYNAMADEASIGGQNGWRREGVDPLIIFDKEVLKETKVKKISRTKENKADKEYTIWNNKVHNSIGEWGEIQDAKEFLKH